MKPSKGFASIITKIETDGIYSFGQIQLPIKRDMLIRMPVIVIRPSKKLQGNGTDWFSLKRPTSTCMQHAARHQQNKIMYYNANPPNFSRLN